MTDDTAKPADGSKPSAGAVTANDVGAKPDRKPKTIKRPPADKIMSARSGGTPYQTKG